ncbi:hypothetical protein [Ureibacillus chungkukjangi]|uniref:Uncharacterized protein n=1 Tax=Ureibacillus chungkukjangi TaxID=1202712 RepID=A0A318TRW1_9BACL|nr:hypothetical protein [Ureibacillus chungkukjangi]PYF06667.1 hypothetical protein BJ095_10888 [Ureibacillus chungkukjangi]
MKIDREVQLLERAISQSDYPQARKIIELHIDKFKKQFVRSTLSMEALALVNVVLNFHGDADNKDVYSRETLLIIQHINKLARDFRFAEIKRFSFLQKELLSNPKIYDALSSDAKALIAPPTKES